MKDQTIRLLLDTNVLIQTEEYAKIEKTFSELINLSHKHPVQLFLHSGTIEDIKRDKNTERRDIILSKIEKYDLLENIPCPDKAELEAEFGSISKDNDFIDVQLLHALKIKAVSFLITEDNGIHARAKRAGLEDKVLLVSEAVSWIRQTYEPRSVKLPHVAYQKCHEVDVRQEIFQSLKADYEGFEKWFEGCIENHRDCWTVLDGKKIIAIAILKEESGKEYKSDFVEGESTLGNEEHVLKICTFKVGDEARGSKIGEHLLKQSLWHAYENNFDCVYLTAFEDKQEFLISFLEEFGFSSVGKNQRGEVFLEKRIVREIASLEGLSPLECHKKYYPCYYDGPEIQKFFVPVQPYYHLKLFPEYTEFHSEMLFGAQIKDEISGNTIKKIYLSRAASNKPKAGDLVFFYMSKNDEKKSNTDNYKFLQCLTIVGVVDKVVLCADSTELSIVNAKRSVYSQHDIDSMFDGKTKPVKAMDFLIAGHIQTDQGTPPDLEHLQNFGIVGGNPPQSIAQIDEAAYQIFKNSIQIVHGREDL